MYSIRVIIIFVYIWNIMFLALKKLIRYQLQYYLISNYFFNQQDECKQFTAFWIFMFVDQSAKGLPKECSNNIQSNGRWRRSQKYFVAKFQAKKIQADMTSSKKQEATGLNGHLSNIYFTLTSCQKGSYNLYINRPIIE